MRFAEDIDEDFDEMDDEDLDDSYSERRRRRSRVRGRDYAAGQRGPANPNELRAAFARVAADVRKLAAGQKDLEVRINRTRTDSGQANQMAAMLPLLIKPKAKTLAELAAAGELTTSKFVVESNDTLSTMLPLLLLGGMGGSSNSSGGGSSDNMMMMMAVAMMAGRK